MDVATLRARLPGMTRGVFGERVTLRPMAAGKMSAGPDPSRPMLKEVPARWDAAPDIEQMGGGRERAEAARIDSDHCSASFDLADPLLVWSPDTGDQVVRTNPITQINETYRIDRTATPVAGVLLCWLSRIS